MCGRKRAFPEYACAHIYQMILGKAEITYKRTRIWCARVRVQECVSDCGVMVIPVILPASPSHNHSGGATFDATSLG